MRSVFMKRILSIIVLFITAIILIFPFIFNYNENVSLEGKDKPDNIPLEEAINEKEDISDDIKERGDFTEDSIKPNELGKVMVIMYHDVSNTEGEWSRHYKNFRQDLETFYEKGYRLISIKDFLDNNINVPRGFSPMILTLDDGTRGQFNLIEDEKGNLTVDPLCAVGIIEQFNKEHPDFGTSAIFYINYPVPFGQREYLKQKLDYIIANGMDIGNHTLNHVKLGSLGKEKVEKEIALHIKKTLELIGGNYKIDTLALPYGNSSKQNIEYIISGEYEDVKYRNRGILLVGAEPALSPAHKDFNSFKIPRIRGSQIYIDKWLKYFDENPSEKYISDGKSNTITIPKSLEKDIDLQKNNGKQLVLY